MRYPNLHYDKVIAMTEIISNNEPSLANFGFNPSRCQFDNYISSTVLRKRLMIDKKKQEQARRVYESLADDQKLKPNDAVRLKLQKTLIRKESSLFNPLISKEIYHIDRCDSTRLPVKYSLKEMPKTKFWYSWNLQKIDENILKEAEKTKKEILKTDNNNSTIMVNDIIFRDTKTLRSGKNLQHQVMYEIMHKNHKEYLTKENLLLYKKIFSNDTLQYSPKFDLKEFQQYVI